MEEVITVHRVPLVAYMPIMERRRRSTRSIIREVDTLAQVPARVIVIRCGGRGIRGSDVKFLRLDEQLRVARDITNNEHNGSSSAFTPVELCRIFEVSLGSSRALPEVVRHNGH